MNQPTVLSIAAHPDDTEIFCAGCLKLLVDKGFKVVIATMTPGGLGGIGISSESKTSKLRKIEAQKAAKILGAEYYCLDERDGYIFDCERARIKTTTLIRKVKPDIILTHLPYDYCVDHRTTSNIIEAAALVSTLPNVSCKEKPLEKTILLYFMNTLNNSDVFGNPITIPPFYINIESVVKTKLEMLSCHQTQIEVMRIEQGMPDFFGEMEKRFAKVGEIAGVAYAEAYWQHLGGGFSSKSLLQDVLKDFLITKFDSNNDGSNRSKAV